MALSSEEAYLFVHIALREAAYQLWLPSDRARLHGVSLEILEAGADERLSAELAAHARLARQQPGLPKAEFERLRLAEVKHLCRASALAKRLHQGAQEIQIFRRLLECDDNFERNAQTELRLAQGLYNTGQLGETKAHYENLCAMDLPDSAMSVRAEALLGLAELAANRGEIKHAEDFSNESIMLSRSMGLGGEESLGLTRLANLYADSGRSELAEEMHLRAVKLARDAGRESVALSALGNLSNHYRVLGKFAESAQSLREVLEGFRKLGDMRNEGVALANLGRTYLMLDDLNQAETCLEQALKIQEQTGIQRSIAFALGSLAELWIRRGKLDAALAALVRTADLFEEAGAHMHRAGFRSALAGLHLLLGERERAQEVIEEVRTEFIQSGLGQYLAEYCDSVRLRIAADEAAMGDVTQRKTVKLGALPPKAAWLPIMKHILAGIRIASQNPKSVTAELTRRVESGTALVAEIESAVKQGRPALVFRGHLPGEFTPEQCRALLEKCGKHSAPAGVLAVLAARAVNLLGRPMGRPYNAAMNLWHDLSTGPEVPDIVNAVIEIPKGSRNKYELDKDSGAIKLDRVLYSALHYPCDYGIIPRTFYDDGDPFDIMVMVTEPTFPGCVIAARPIALWKMLDRGARDYKVLAVPAKDPLFGHYKDIGDVPPHFLREVFHFFEVYKDLEGQHVEPLGWENAASAKREIKRAIELYRDMKVHSKKPRANAPKRK